MGNGVGLQVGWEYEYGIEIKESKEILIAKAEVDNMNLQEKMVSTFYAQLGC